MKTENEHYLSDWLAEKISDEQLQQLVSEEDFLAFQKIKKMLDTSTVSARDISASFDIIKQKIAAKKEVKTRKILPLWSYAVAACLVISFGLYQLYFMSNEVQTSFGDTKTIVLKDDSTITLNAKSKVCYSNLFQYNRTIELDGEAFFEVEKGGSFVVKTALGTVEVLGTKFNVTVLQDYFEVVCYEGKVQVEEAERTTILTQGESVRVYNHTFENWADITSTKPLWISGETNVNKVPMKYVFAKFEDQFDVKVNFPKNIEDITFTGSFDNRNMETALQSICIPLHLKFSKTSSETIQISK